VKLRRLKKRKLQIKDSIALLRMRLVPDVPRVSGPAPGTATDGSASRLADARRRVAAAFSGGGELASAVAGFSPRASQQEMALAVFDTLAERGTLIAEAGTGTGKTFAYLVPPCSPAERCWCRPAPGRCRTRSTQRTSAR